MDSALFSVPAVMAGNGVFLSEIASQSPSGESHNWTGGVQFLIYGGVAIMPPLFGGLILVANSYIIPFFLIAISSLIASFALVWLYQKYTGYV